MKQVVFISTELGDDLIVSFAIADPDSPRDVLSLTLLRTPKYEHILDDWERGISYCAEDLQGEEDFDLVKEICINQQYVKIESTHHKCILDIQSVPEFQIDSAKVVLREMNFDNRVKLRID